jgi:hypothetical protein
MEKLLLMLEALVIGMRGAKRVAMDFLIKDLWEVAQDSALDLNAAREETERAENHLWDANNRAQKAEMTAKVLGKEIESLRIEIDALHDHEKKLTEDIEQEKNPSNVKLWTLWVRWEAVNKSKIAVMKAVKATANCSLKEAKERVDNGPSGNEISWMLMSEHSTSDQMTSALHMLMTYGEFSQKDIIIHKVPREFYEAP